MNANIYLSDEEKDPASPTHAFTPSVLLDRKVVVHDVVETAKKYVPLMRALGAQLVGAFPHGGFEKGPVA